MANPQPTQQSFNQQKNPSDTQAKQAYGQQKPGVDQQNKTSPNEKAEWKSDSSCSSEKDASCSDKDMGAKKGQTH